MNKVILDCDNSGKLIIKSSEGKLTDEEATQILKEVFYG